MSWLTCLSAQARHHHDCWSELIAGLDLETALYRTDGGGPSIAWLLGHCTHEADTTLEAVGGQPRRLDPKLDGRGGQPHWGAHDQSSWASLQADWAQTSSALLGSLGTLSPEILEQPCAVELHPAFRESLSSRRLWLQGHVFHLAYHLGQGRLLRAAAERIPPPEV